MDVAFSERDFFLKSFHGTILTVVITEHSDLGEESMGRFLKALLPLLDSGGRVVVLFQDVEPLFYILKTGLQDLAARTLWGRHILGARQALPLLWPGKKTLCMMGFSPVGGLGAFLRTVVQLATDVRVSRLLWSEAEGGLVTEEAGVVGFMQVQALAARLHNSHGLTPHRRLVLTTLLDLLQGGVGAISLLRLADIGRELYTFEGCGTFFAHHYYCQVRSLGLDDVAQVATLIRHGEQEGYLLPRDRVGVLSILIEGYGAFIGTGGLVGVCGLLTIPYQKRAGEIVALYTLTRFKGKGVGKILVEKIKAEATIQGLAYLFACTPHPRVGDFLFRLGFRPVGQ
ncbi:MAG: GNAT family N-acetyltransferase, partial [Magnetococcus sp. DMHC-6]